MDFKIEISAERALASLNLLARRGRDLAPAMADIAVFLLLVVENAFEQERDPTTLTPWERLSDSTIEQRRRKGTWPGKKLFATGDMQRSLVSDSDETSASVGIAAVRGQADGYFYPAGHQFGTRRMPARPFLGFSPADEDSVLEIVGSYLMPD